MARHTPFFNIFQQAARRFNLDPALLMAVAKQESRFKANAVSPAGAQGVMQIMPATGKQLGLKDPFNPVENIVAGAAYLSQLMDRFGDVELALAAYNGGQGRLAQRGRDISRMPPETRDYVPKVMGYYKEFGPSSSDGRFAPSQPEQATARRVTPQRVQPVTSEVMGAQGPQLPSSPEIPTLQPVESEPAQAAKPDIDHQKLEPLRQKLKEAQRHYPEALKFLSDADEPPQLDSLNPMTRAMITAEAGKLGVDPQEAIDYAWAQSKEATATLEPSKPALDKVQPRKPDRAKPTRPQRPEKAPTQKAQTSKPGPRSSDPRQYLSDLSASRFDAPTLDSLGIGKEKVIDPLEEEQEQEPFLGSMLGLDLSSPQVEGVEQELPEHPPPLKGDFPIPQRSGGSDRLRQIIMERMAKQRERLSQITR